VWKKPRADAGPDLKTRLGLPVALKGTAKGSNVSWFWSPSGNISAPLQLNPLVNPTQTATYTLHVTSNHGCGTSTDDVLVKVFDKIAIPNAFSPNGDGINDRWLIQPLDLFEESVTEVYNRYGQIVYRSRGYGTPWNGTNNGKPVPAGTYYYIIDLRVNKEPKLTGTVTILR
jgi:gliding motility-associated-like protein